MTDGVSDDDDNSENKSVDSMANRKRKLNTILGSNKRMHVEYPAKAETDQDSDSNHDNTDRTASINDNDDCGSSRMSDFDDGKFICALKFCFNSLYHNLNTNLGSTYQIRFKC